MNNQQKAEHFARAVIQIAEQRVDEMFERLQAERDEPGVYYIGGPLPASAEDEAKHQAIMSLNVKPKGIKSFAEWRAKQGV